MSNFNADTLDKIREMSRPEKIEAGGKEYITSEYRIVEPPRPSCLTIHTLTGFLEYIKENPDNIEMEKCYVSIEDYSLVKLISPIDPEWKKRTTILCANYTTEHFKYERWDDPESTIIGMNAGFVNKGDFKYVLEIISNITQETKNELKDNGISQSTAVKTGFGGMLENITIKNPVDLYPFRTFPNVEQPLVQSIFRINQSGNVGFFEVGDKWKLEAISNIKKWFTDNECPLKIIA